MADLTRKTANLFDADTWYGAYKQADGTYQTDRNTWHTLVVKPFTNDDIGKSFCFAADVSPSSGNARFTAVINGVQINGQYTGNRCKVSFTVRTIDDSILFDYGSGSTTITTVSNIMLNTGDTALAYEPYGWVHSLRKMSSATETIQSGDTIYANGQPISTYSIKGNTVQDGTPTPSNPVIVNGVGNKTANLLNIAEFARRYPNNCSYQDNTLDVNLLTGDLYNTGITVDIPANTFFSCTPISNTNSATNGRIRFVFSDDTTLEVYITYSQGEASPSVSQALNKAVKSIRLNWSSANGGFAFKFAMINTGSTALPYEPYGQYKIPISTTQGSAVNYLGSVQSTRKIKKIVFVGSEDENWSAQSAGGGAMRFRYTISNSVQADTAHPTSICTHLPLGAEGGTWNTDDIYTIASNYLWVRLDSSFTTVASLKSWLEQQYANGTPFTVWYVLATPETGMVNEPLIKIGDYSDSISNAATIPTTDGANTISVDTTVQPSEFTATWTGWHDSSVQEYDGADWQ